VSSNLDRKSKIRHQNAWRKTNDIFVSTFVHAIKQSTKVPDRLSINKKTGKTSWLDHISSLCKVAKV